jgi:hypothetical protein
MPCAELFANCQLRATDDTRRLTRSPMVPCIHRSPMVPCIHRSPMVPCIHRSPMVPCIHRSPIHRCLTTPHGTLSHHARTLRARRPGLQAELDPLLKLAPDWQPLLALADGPGPLSGKPSMTGSAAPEDRMPSESERQTAALLAAMRRLPSDGEGPFQRYGILLELQPGLPEGALAAAVADWPTALESALAGKARAAARRGACKPVVEGPPPSTGTPPSVLRLSVFLCEKVGHGAVGVMRICRTWRLGGTAGAEAGSGRHGSGEAEGVLARCVCWGSPRRTLSSAVPGAECAAHARHMSNPAVRTTRAMVTVQKIKHGHV